MPIIMDSTHERQILAEGKFLRLVKRGRWEWVERTNCRTAAAIAAVTKNRELILVEQFRFPLNCLAIELPAGLVGDQPGAFYEELIPAAKRELLEETGYEAPHWQYCTEGPSSPGLTLETYTLFLASEAVKIHDGGGDESENIRVHVVPLDKIEDWLAEQRQNGLMVDPKIYAGLYFIHTRLFPSNTSGKG